MAQRRNQSRWTPRARTLRRLPDLQALRETGGGALAVSDDDMIEAMYTLAATEGVIACPEGAATLVGLQRLLDDGSIGADEEVVLLNTARATSISTFCADRANRAVRPGPHYRYFVSLQQRHLERAVGFRGVLPQMDG